MGRSRLKNETVLTEALAEARKIIDPAERASLLGRRTRCWPADLRAAAIAEARAAAAAVKSADAGAKTLAALSRRLPSGERQECLVKALNQARQVTGAGPRATLLASMADRLKGKDIRKAALADAIDAAAQETDGRRRARAIATLCSRVPLTQIKRLTELSSALDRDLDLSLALEAIARRAPKKTFKDLESSAKKIANERFRVRVLSVLVRRGLAMPDDAIRGLADGRDQVSLFINIAERLPVDQRRRYYSRALKVTYHIGDAGYLARLHAALSRPPGPRSGEFFALCLKEIGDVRQEKDRASVISDVAKKCPPEQWSALLGLARSIQEKKYRFNALAALIPTSPEGPSGAEVAAEAEAIAKRLGEVDPIKKLAAVVPPVQLPGLLAAALRDTPDWYCDLIEASAPRLSGEGLHCVWGSSLTVADESSRARALVALAPSFKGDLPAQVLDAIRGLGQEEERSRLLIAFAPYLGGDDRAREMARDHRRCEKGRRAGDPSLRPGL